MKQSDKQKRFSLKQLVQEAVHIAFRHNRRLQGKSQRAVAKRAGMSQSRLSRIERSQSVPTDQEIDRLCRALGLKRRKVEKIMRSIIKDL